MAHSREQAVIAEEKTVLTKDEATLAGGVLEYSVPTAIEVEPGTWMRKGGLGTALWVAFDLANALFYGGLVVLGFAETIRSGEVTVWLIPLVLFFGSLAGFGACLAVRMARAGLRISHRGVDLRGVFKTRRLPLVEVERFAPGVFSSGLARSEIGVTIVRRKGRHLPVWALRGGASSSRGGLEAAFAAMQPLCDELNDLLVTMKGEPMEEREMDGGEEPLTRAGAEKSYRTIRAYLIGSAIWFLAIAAVAAALDFAGWQIYLGVVLVAEGIGTPLFLRFHRRELERRVRASEEALGKAGPGKAI